MSSENSMSAVQKRLEDLAAENRVLMEGSKVMRHECNQAWVCGLNLFGSKKCKGKRLPITYAMSVAVTIVGMPTFF